MSTTTPSSRHMQFEAAITKSSYQQTMKSDSTSSYPTDILQATIDSNKMRELNDSTSSFDVNDLLSSKQADLSLSRPSESSSHSKATKRVTFDKIIRWRSIPHHKNMTKSLKGRVWNSRQELQNIRSEITATIRLLSLDVDLGETATTSGLDCYLLETQERRLAARSQAFEAVFSSVETSSTSNNVGRKKLAGAGGANLTTWEDVSSMADSYAEACAKSKAEAYARGQKCFEEVKSQQ